MRYHTLLCLLVASAHAAPLLQPRDNPKPSKDLDKAAKQIGQAYESALKEYQKAAGKSNADLQKAYSEYAKQVGAAANDAKNDKGLKDFEKCRTSVPSRTTLIQE